MFGISSRYFFLLLCISGFGLGSVNRCDEVRKVFQMRQIGPNQLVPPSPRPGRCNRYRDNTVLCVCILIHCSLYAAWCYASFSLWHLQRQITTNRVTMTLRMLTAKCQPPTWGDLTHCPVPFDSVIFSLLELLFVVPKTHLLRTHFVGVCAVMIIIQRETGPLSCLNGIHSHKDSQIRTLTETSHAIPPKI